MVFIAIMAVSFSACNQTAGEQGSSTDMAETTVPVKAVNVSTKQDPKHVESIILSAPDETVIQKGKELLEEYDIPYNQTIRFPFEGRFYESHGSYALTSLEEAREKYPDWPIPEKLGDYQFADLTLELDRTENVFTNAVPTNDKVTIKKDKDPSVYFLCYQNGSTRFKIEVIPISLGPSMFDDLSDTMTAWPFHPNAYLSSNDNDMCTFRDMIIVPRENERYAYLIHKITGDDCLESDIVTFNEEEAESIYQGIREGFGQEPGVQMNETTSPKD